MRYFLPNGQPLFRVQVELGTQSISNFITETNIPSSNPFATPEKLHTQVLKNNHQLNISRGLSFRAARVVETKELLAMSISQPESTPILASSRKFDDNYKTANLKSKERGNCQRCT